MTFQTPLHISVTLCSILVSLFPAYLYSYNCSNVFVPPALFPKTCIALTLSNILASLQFFPKFCNTISLSSILLPPQLLNTSLYLFSLLLCKCFVCAFPRRHLFVSCLRTASMYIFRMGYYKSLAT